jgi:hypothetical protein
MLGCLRKKERGSNPELDVKKGIRANLPQVRLNLDFSSQLMFDTVLSELLLEQDFQGDDEFAFLFPGQVDVTKLAFTEGLANIEVTERPSLERLLLGNLHLGS